MNGENQKQKLWFKRKKYGWGWHPVTWQGWLVVFVWVLLFAFILEKFYQDGNLTKLLISFFVIVTLLVFVSYKKGEKPKWRWGDDK